jgi:hypothetical protein
MLDWEAEKGIPSIHSLADWLTRFLVGWLLQTGQHLLAGLQAAAPPCSGAFRLAHSLPGWAKLPVHFGEGIIRVSGVNSLGLKWENGKWLLRKWAENFHVANQLGRHFEEHLLRKSGLGLGQLQIIHLSVWGQILAHFNKLQGKIRLMPGNFRKKDSCLDNVPLSELFVRGEQPIIRVEHFHLVKSVVADANYDDGEGQGGGLQGRTMPYSIPKRWYSPPTLTITSFVWSKSVMAPSVMISWN